METSLVCAAGELKSDAILTQLMHQEGKHTLQKIDAPNKSHAENPRRFSLGANNRPHDAPGGGNGELMIASVRRLYQRNPLLANSATGFAVFGAGDVLAQYASSGTDAQSSSNSSSSSSSSKRTITRTRA